MTLCGGGARVGRGESLPVGRGEALPLPAAGMETLEEAERALAAALPRCVGEWRAPEECLDGVAAELAGAPAARFALEAALLELAAREAGLPVARYLASGAARQVRVNALLGAGDAAQTLRDARRAVGQGYRVLKLKVGDGGLAHDEARLEAIRAALGADVALRVDANGAWSRAEAEERLRRWVRFGLELVEQPVAGADLEGLARLARDAPMPVAADEALSCAEGRDALVRGELTPLAVLKPAVQGGIARALDLARRASRRGVACVVTTTLDGPLGTAAALHLAAAAGEPSLAHGLAAAEWVDAPFAAALRPRGGALALAARPGFGEVAP